MADTAESLPPEADVVTLADGGRILVRPLAPSDREELAERYLELSPDARRLRFFNAPDHLSDRLLDYLMDVEGSDRCALVAQAIDENGGPGVGLARYVRLRDDPTCAEAAVTVLDTHHNRGIATALLRHLADDARDHGIRTFNANVMWENRHLLDALRAHGADVSPSEPGVALVKIDVPGPDAGLPESPLHGALRVFAAQADDVVELRFHH